MMQSGNYDSKSLIYNKALEIKMLSRDISRYLNYDMTSLCKEGKENPAIYLTGDIILHSYLIETSIIEAENEMFSEHREKYITAIEKWTHRLHKNCERLEQSVDNGKDFIRLLKYEIRKFRVLHRKWRMSL